MCVLTFFLLDSLPRGGGLNDNKFTITMKAAGKELFAVEFSALIHM